LASFNKYNHSAADAFGTAWLNLKWFSANFQPLHGITSINPANRSKFLFILGAQQVFVLVKYLLNKVLPPITLTQGGPF